MAKSKSKGGSRKNDLSFVIYMILEDGSVVPWEDLTEEQIQRFRENACKRLSENMNAYYAQHPDEYALLKSRE